MTERMTVDRWRKVGDLFDRVVTLPRPDRAALLSQEAAGDPSLRAEVEGLLQEADDDGIGLFDTPAASLLEPTDPSAPPRPSLAYGEMIGAFRVLELVGRGGMGEVYRAERADGQFEQEVALKLIRQDAVEAVERFHAERRILARLEHSGIARLYDGGVHRDGRPWMVMEWVDGTPITQWCREHDADLRQRLALFQLVCEAVACAHRNLLVHRDLKPSNVLVTQDGRVKLLDFGIAKRLADDQELTAHLSPMTPAYAAPEQLEQKPVTTATDIYTLGLILFELLCGERPFQTEKLTVYQAMGKVLREPPPPPSVQAARHSTEEPPVAPEALRGDLDAIVAKALRKEPERRYATVAEFQADVERYGSGAPVEAREGARLYVASRLLRRYRWAVAAVSALIVTLIAGLAGVAWQARVAQRHAEEAHEQAETAEAVQKFLEGLFLANSTNQEDPEKARQRTARELLDVGAARIDTSMDDAPVAKLRVLGTLQRMYREMDLGDRELEINGKRVALARKVYGPDAPELASALLDLGDSQLQVSPQEARLRYDEVGVILDRIGDHASALRASYEGSLAEYHFQHGYAEALPHVQEAVRLFRLLPVSREFFLTLYLQAIILMDGGDYAGARTSLQESLRVQQALGKDALNDHLPYLYVELGFAETFLGDFQNGIAHQRQAVDMAVQFNGEETSDTVFARRNLGGALGRTGHLAESLQVLARARTTARLLQKAGNATMEGVGTLERLAESQVLFGDVAQGAATLAEAEAMRAGLDATPDSVDANLHERHAAIDLETGDWAAAARELDQSTAVFRKLGLEGKPAMRDTVVLRTRVLRLSGDLAGAVKAFQDYDLTGFPDAMSLREAEGTAIAAELSLAGGQSDAALHAAAVALAKIEAGPNQDWLRLQEIRLRVVSGLALLAQDRAADAVAMLQKAVNLAAKTFDPVLSPQLAQVQVALGQAALAAGDRPLARSMAVAASAIQANQPVLPEVDRASLQRLKAAAGA